MAEKPRNSKKNGGTPTMPEWPRRYGVHVPQWEEPDEDNLDPEKALRYIKEWAKQKRSTTGERQSCSEPARPPLRERAEKALQEFKEENKGKTWEDLAE